MNVRSWITDGRGSIAGRARQRRWTLLNDIFPDLASYRVLDLGGTTDSWLQAPVQPKSLTLLNLHASELGARPGSGSLPEWTTLCEGDACEPPDEIRESDYDLVFSNSLIEHVGGLERRRRLADFIRNAAARYWVQTPYRYFPIEPHWIFPGFQFLPLRARAELSRRWPLVHTRATDLRDGVAAALEVELLSLTELRHLFGDAELHSEKFAGMIKSVVAVRRSS